MGLLQVIKLRPTGYGVDYWAMHFAAALMCLHDHGLLEASPKKLVAHTWPRWTLAEFRGTADRSAFSRMRMSIQNWGAQYLLAHVLHADVLGVVEPLLQAISSQHGVALGKPAECYVAGKDSRAGGAFLTSCRARIVGDRRRRVYTSHDTMNASFSDLCILAAADQGENALAIFGEVEGNHGELLRRASYWHAKSPWAHFGIGLVQRQAEPALLSHCEGRAVLTLGTTDNVISDFHLAVQWLEKLVDHGPSDQWWRRMSEPGLTEAVALLTTGWHKPIVQLLEELGYGCGSSTEAPVGIASVEVPDIWPHERRLVTTPEIQLVAA